MTNKKQLRVRFFCLLALLLVFLVFSILLVAYLKNDNKTITSSYAQKITENKGVAVKQQLDSDFLLLRSISASFSELGYDTLSPTDQTVRSYLAKVNQFSRIAFVDLDGNGCVYSDEKYYCKNFLSYEFFNDVVENASERIVRIQFDDNNSNLATHIAVPIFGKDSSVQAVLIAAKTYDFYQSPLSSSVFDGNGHFGLVDENLYFVLVSDNAAPFTLNQTLASYFNLDEEVFSNLKTLRRSRAATEAEFFSYSIRYMDSDYTLLLTSMEINPSTSWYMISFFESTIFSVYSNRLILTTSAIIAASALMFAGLVVLQHVLTSNAQRRLEDVAYTDPVTKGLNKQKFIIDAGNLLNENKGNLYMIWAFEILDYTEILNIYGREGLNIVIAKMADILRENARLAQIFARERSTFFGIVEFDSKENLRQNLDLIKKVFSDLEIYPTQNINIRLAGGLYVVKESDRHGSVETMMNNAILAKSYAKSGQKSEYPYQYYTEEMQKTAQIGNEINSGLKDAIANGEITFYLQPKIDIKDGERVVGAEALARWFSKTHGTIPPAKFIPLLEKSGTVIDVDRFIFKEVCKWYTNNPFVMENNLKISVNVSRQALNAHDFLDYYVKTKADYNIPDNVIELEFTESIATDNYYYFIRALKILKSAGFLCSLDDFGAGYSSFNAFLHLPIDTLKLDAAFFENTVEKDKQDAILRSVTYMCKKLNIETVAEGVEKIESVKLLKSIGCRVVQGYYYSRPLAVDKFKEFVDRNLEEWTVAEEVSRRG